MAQKVEVTWVALECRQRQEKSDEVYGTVSAIPGSGSHVIHTFPGDRPYWNMGKSGERIVTVGVPLYSGPPTALSLIVSLVENDSANVDAYKKAAAEVISKGAGAVAVAFSGGGAAAGQPLIDKLADELVDVAARVLGTGDDPYNPATIRLDESILANPSRPRHRLSRPDDPRTAEYTDRVVVTGRDDGGDIGEYGFYFDIRVTGQPDHTQEEASQHGMGVPKKLTTVFAASPTAAVSWGPNRIDVFYQQPDFRSKGVGHRSWNGSRWSRPDEHGDSSKGIGIAVASRAPDRLDVFYSANAPRTLWHIAWDGRRWQEEQNLGGELVRNDGQLTAVSWGPDRLDVFYRGPDNQLVQRAHRNDQWSDEVDLGYRGLVAGRPAAVSRGANRIDVFFRGTDNQLHQALWNGRRWSHVELGGNVAGDPAAIFGVEPDMLQVFYYHGQLGRIVCRIHVDGRWKTVNSSKEIPYTEEMAEPHGLSVASPASMHLDLFYTSLEPGETPTLWHRHYQGAS